MPKDIRSKIATFICNALSELLLNVKKHSKAEKTEIDINQKENCLILIVKDNGIGFEDSLYNEGKQKIGYGLSSIIEKVNQFNGTCEIKSVLNTGTEIKILLPL